MKKSLILVFCAMFTVSCELFTGPRVDLFQIISNEVDWAKAAKLTVKLNFPREWGTSNPQQGSLTPTKDIRKGYEFSLEFTPGAAYTLSSWQAYWTSDLDTISGQTGQIGNWLEDPTLIEFAGIEPLGPDEITLPVSNPLGGTFKFKIHAVQPVTIVPWCMTEPRITRAEPRTGAKGESYARTSDIVLYFNGALDKDTIKFMDDPDGENDYGIWITAKSLDGGIIFTNKDMHWYSAPEYSDRGFFTVTMNPRILPPENSLMTITVKGIKNEQGDPMKGVYTFSWKTKSDTDISLDSWEGVYAHNATANTGSINIVASIPTNADDIKTYYRLNGGARTPFSGSIDNIPGPDVSGVRTGGQVGGIREYEILIELYAQGVMENITSFKIWNIPGMKTSDTSPLVEVRTAAELAAMKNNLGGQYVLANDITVTTAWTPIGSGSGATFQGKLYGNGHKITFSSDSTIGGTTNYRGLFGYAQGLSALQPALIRDVTFEYNALSSISANGGSYIGGIAGYAVNTGICNVTVSGGTLGNALNITAPSGTSAIHLGGIVGYIEGSGKIENCRATLSTAYTSSGHTGEIRIGAIAGGTGEGGAANKTVLNNGLNFNIELTGLLLDGISITANVSANKKNYEGGFYIGGAVGASGKNTMKDITFTAGTVSFYSSTSSLAYYYCGGIVGNSVNTSMVDCSFSGSIGLIPAPLGGESTAVNIRCGGLAGSNSSTSGNYYIHNCRAGGNIEANSNRSVVVGGILGNSDISNSVSITVSLTITNSFFENGEIKIKCSAINSNIGGFCGFLGGNHILNNCGALAGTIDADAAFVNTNEFYLGGFCSRITDGAISNCFSRINITANVCARSYVGGFVGFIMANSKISACYAAGTVTATVPVGLPIVEIYIGGLAGNCQGAIIENSYALGDVLTNSFPALSTVQCSAGVITGNLMGSGTIKNCFSKGQVSFKATSTGAFSGGIAGTAGGNSTIMNTAALGAAVTALSSNISRRNAGRIYGRIMTGVIVCTDNYALSTMVIEEDLLNAIEPYQVRPADSGLTTKDGLNTPASRFNERSFWDTRGLGFSDDEWLFTTVGTKGYPILRSAPVDGVPGPALAGQL